MITALSPPSQPDSRRWWILAVLCLSVLLVVVDNTIVNVALPTISRQLSASTQDLQWIVDAYTLVFAGLLLVGGNLGDRLGRRRVLQAGLALFAVTSVGAALARSTGELIAGRAAMGIAAALIYPATLALLTSTFTIARERATAIGIWSGVSGLAVAVGPVTGGLLLRHFSWNSVFYVNVPIVVIALVAGLRLLPETRDAQAGRFDPLGALASVAGVGLLVWTVIEAPRHGWTSVTSIAGFAGAAVLLAAFAAWQLRRPDPMLDVRLFRNPRFTAASGAIALAFFGLFGFIFMITQYFQVVRGYNSLHAGVATLPFAIVTGACSPAAIALMKRLGTKVIVTAGLGLMSAGFLVAAGTAVDSAFWGRIIVAMILMAAGLALTTSPATEAIMGSLPAAKAGAGSAVNDTTRELGGTLGVAIVGSVLSSAYASHVLTALTRIGAPAAVRSAAQQSVVAGLDVAAHLPPGLREVAAAAARQAFVDGLRAGSLVAAGATALAALATLAFLPARVRPPAVDAQPAADARPGLDARLGVDAEPGVAARESWAPLDGDRTMAR
jgi:DHA2 family multidrug resistance protein-like MFS transporter